MRQLFAWEFQHQKSHLSKGLAKNLSDVDRIIISAAPAWPLSKIAKIDLSILRLAVYELCFEKKVPAKVAIDEAVELAKEFGADQSSSFINGVLGTVYESYQPKPAGN